MAFNNKKLNLIMKQNSNTQVEHLTSSHTIGNTDVVRRLESVMSKFGEAHNMMARTKLSKEDYQPISSLMSKAKVELFNIYYELKNNKNG